MMDYRKDFQWVALTVYGTVHLKDRTKAAYLADMTGWTMVESSVIAMGKQKAELKAALKVS